MKNYKAAVIGATGMVGQRLLTLLENHPSFSVTALAASPRSAGKTYAEAVKDRWMMKLPLPKKFETMPVYNAEKDVKKISELADFVFCAVDMGKNETLALEELYAKSEMPVISNNSANRNTFDVPMIIPEINPEHAEIIPAQRERLGTRRGFIAVKSNCSVQSFMPAVHPLMEFKIKSVLACTYQAVSGAGKKLETWTEMQDNIIPYINGEEEKSETEPLKIWGRINGKVIVNAFSPSIATQCIRVPVSDGHMAAVFVKMERKPDLEWIKNKWTRYVGLPQKLGLPSAPKQFLHYFEEKDRPQTKLDRDLENGMAVSIGRLRWDTQYDIKFVCLSHNTLRGAAGGAVLTAELLAEQGYFD